MNLIKGIDVLRPIPRFRLHGAARFRAREHVLASKRLQRDSRHAYLV